ncbi:MAG: diacylglycerol kinase family lipid kinase [Bacteroidales bacterium]|nr:diacylglycerol kinase family lipid kinase [Bacteroidales bacterium]
MAEHTINAHEWLVVVNPNAGNRRGEKDWPVIKNKLFEHGLKFKAVFTKGREHAISLTSAMIGEGYRKIIVVGGDGTLNEVVNGIFFQQSCSPDEMLIGMIPVGTGNDWGKMYDLPKKYGKAIKVINRGHTFVQDVGFVKYHDKDGEHERYFVNVSGMGYDALVAEKTNRMKDRGRGGSLAYLLNIFTGLFQYSYTPFVISVDGSEVFSGRVLSMNIGICKYNGGGLMQLPGAIPNDGLLDVTVIKATPRINIFKHITKLYDGTFIKLKFVSTFRGRECRIVSQPAGTVYLEADGESLGHSPLNFSVKQEALRFIIPKQ